MKFLKSTFSEPGTESGSFGRVAFGFVILVSMGLITFSCISKTPRPYVPTLEQWAWFLTTVGAVTYGANKLATAWGNNRVDAGRDKQ